MIYPWGTDRRFNAYADYFRKYFGGRVQKLTINAGFTCPNRDGKLGKGGCTFCDNRAFSPSYNKAIKTVAQQIEEGISFHKKRYRRVEKYMAYFQSYTNTYAPLEELDAIYRQALEFPEVVGIVIGTRPDCVNEELLDYFRNLSLETHLVLEYGIESVCDETLERINRGHYFEASVNAIMETAKRGIRAGGHIIIGLPGEDEAFWMKSIETLSALPLNSIKFHQLQLIKGTAMAAEYSRYPERFREFEMEEYLQLMADLIEKLNPRFVVERIAGEVNPLTAVKQGWGIRYDRVLARFEKILEERDSWQGKKYG